MKYYCGSWWTPRWVRRILSVKFNASCKVHDLDYHTTKFTREEADTRFLLHMVKQAKGSIFWEIIATLFYIFVRMLGKLSYGVNKAKKMLDLKEN
ncbi:MAG: hypothetical protein HWN81_19355 [Candidatus Lokiarchaeota archaeon]|nr:hypothetical protein [Candidatus Lokiarchaeota archaeon]